MLFPNEKTIYLQIIKNTLEKITKSWSNGFDKLNINIVFKIAWIRFLHLRKITYTSIKLTITLFLLIIVIRSNISFSKNN